MLTEEREPHIDFADRLIAQLRVGTLKLSTLSHSQRRRQRDWKKLRRTKEAAAAWKTGGGLRIT